MKSVLLLTNNDSNYPILKSQLLPYYDGYTITVFLKKNIGGLDENKINIISFHKHNFLCTYVNYLAQLTKFLYCNKTSLVHARGFVSGLVYILSSFVVFLGKNKLVYDPRGPFLIQRKELGFTKSSIYILKQFEALIVKKSSLIILESESLIDYFIQEYGAKEKYLLIYNTTLLPINKNRSKGLNNVAYLGTFNYWHPYTEVIKLFLHFKKINPSSKFFIFNCDLDKKIKSEFISIFFNDIVFQCVEYDSLGKKLSKIDIGVVPILNSESNQYTTPIKYFDYMSAGIKIVSTNACSDIIKLLISKESILLYEYSKPDFDVDQLKILKTNYLDVIQEHCFANSNAKLRQALKNIL